MKKIVSVFLSLIILVSSIATSSMTALAEENKRAIDINFAIASYLDFDYSVDTINKTITLNSYKGTNTNILIPSTMKIFNNNFTVFLNKSFKNNQTVQNIYIYGASGYGNSLDELFMGASNLITVNGTIGNAYSITSLNRICKDCVLLEEFGIDMNNMGNVKYKFGNSFENCHNIKYISPFPYSTPGFQNTFNSTQYLKSITVNASEPISGFAESVDYMLSSTDKKELTIKFPANTKAYRYYYSYFTHIGSQKATIKTIDDVEDNANKISCYGDSITASSYNGGITGCYPMQLNDMLNNEYITENKGVSGDSISMIAYRSGAWKMFVDEFTIPTTITSVSIKIRGEKGGNLPTSPMRVSINDITGTITATRSGNTFTYSFKRDVIGLQSKVSAGTTIKILNDISTLNENDVLVIHAGTNDTNSITISDRNKIEYIISTIEDMLNYSNTKKYIICGITTANKYNASNSILYENMMKEEFGCNFVNLREYFLNNAFEITGLSIDDTSRNEMNIGQVPSVFKGDGLHENANGQKVNAKGIFDKLQEDNFGHIFLNYVTDNNATCIDDGTKTAKCEKCNATNTVIDYNSAIGHNFGNNEKYCLICHIDNPNYIEDAPIISDIVPDINIPNSSNLSNVVISDDTNNSNNTVLLNDSGNNTVIENKSSISKPKKSSIKKLKAGKKYVTVTFSKVSKVSGYQIEYSTSKKYSKKTSKRVNIKGNKKNKKTIKKLKSGKKYYVRIRTYKTVNGKKIYSSWSKSKKVLIK